MQEESEQDKVYGTKAPLAGYKVPISKRRGEGKGTG